MHRISADWPAPAHIVAFSTTRQGGASQPPYDSFNLGDHVGDSPQAVRCNRERLVADCAGLQQIQWLQQVHGTEIYCGEYRVRPPEADASLTRHHGLACAVLTADCLPVLFTDCRGEQIAAVHAGWRGLCAGILEHAVDAFSAPADDILAWIGPSIGQAAFEVGPEVRAQFLADFQLESAVIESAFAPAPARSEHYFADLVALARAQLLSLGVRGVWGGGYCTFSDAAQFFSYRRDGTTGRMATLIYKQ